MPGGLLLFIKLHFHIDIINIGLTLKYISKFFLQIVIKIVNKNKLNAIWICDPMHGNTYKNKQGLKTRHFNTILKELSIYMSIHKKLNSNPGGIHIEFTSQDVTECLGGYQNIDDELLMQRYQTACDPRLNNQQSLELIFKLTLNFFACS